jgi:hypothetical protein
LFLSRHSPVPSVLDWRGPYVSLWVVCTSLAVTGLFTWVVAWVGDALEVERHMLQSSVQLHLAAWILLATAFDACLTRSRARASPGDELSTS